MGQSGGANGANRPTNDVTNVSKSSRNGPDVDDVSRSSTKSSGAGTLVGERRPAARRSGTQTLRRSGSTSFPTAERRHLRRANRQQGGEYHRRRGAWRGIADQPPLAVSKQERSEPPRPPAVVCKRQPRRRTKGRSRASWHFRHEFYILVQQAANSPADSAAAAPAGRRGGARVRRPHDLGVGPRRDAAGRHGCLSRRADADVRLHAVRRREVAAGHHRPDLARPERAVLDLHVPVLHQQLAAALLPRGRRARRARRRRDRAQAGRAPQRHVRSAATSAMLAVHFVDAQVRDGAEARHALHARCTAAAPTRPSSRPR